MTQQKKVITPNWTTDDVKIVIKHLKKKKSRDSHGYSNKLIQNGGSDLILAMTKLINNIKTQQKIPPCLQQCDITSIFKN